MNIVINAIVVLLIGLTYWFFFAKKEEEARMYSGDISITVAGGYKPNSIKVKKGTPVTLKFFRKDESSCLEEVVIPEFHVKQFLPVGKQTDVTITPDKAGEFEMSCGMNMFHGKIIVE